MGVDPPHEHHVDRSHGLHCYLFSNDVLCLCLRFDPFYIFYFLIILHLFVDCIEQCGIYNLHRGTSLEVFDSKVSCCLTLWASQKFDRYIFAGTHHTRGRPIYKHGLNFASYT